MELVYTPALGAGAARLESSSLSSPTKFSMMHSFLALPGDTHLVALAVIQKDGCILTGLRNYTDKEWKNASVWTLPGGRSELGETIEQTLKREVYEETGITYFEIEQIIGRISGVKKGDELIIFFCTTKQDATLMEPEKFSEWRFVPLIGFLQDDVYGGFNVDARTMITDFLKNL